MDRGRSTHKATVVGPRIKASQVQKSPQRGISPQKSSPIAKGPSIFAILATKRLVRKFADKVAARRLEREEALRNREFEPTYRMEPHNKFTSSCVEGIIASVVDDRLKAVSYTPKRCAMLSKIMTEEIKEKIKDIGYDRYKLVCVVTMGEKKDQGLLITSRCTWDERLDNSATYNWQNGSMFCSVTVYGLYHE